MHEASVAQSIVRSIIDNAQSQHAARVESVELEVGELTFLNIEQIVFWIQTGLQGTIAENAQMVTQSVPVKIHCKECGFKGPVQLKENPQTHFRVPALVCDQCGCSAVDVIEGKDILIPRIRIVRSVERNDI